MYNPYTQHKRLPEIETAVAGGVSLCLQGLYGSSQALVAGALCSRIPGVHLILIDDKEEAAYFFADLQTVCDPDSVLFLPSSYRRASNQLRPDEGNMIMRNHVISRITKQNPADPLIVVTYPEALQEKVLSADSMGRNTLTLTTGEKISISFLHEMLSAYGFQMADFVYEPGQFAIRGGIVDIFSYASHQPYRIDFFGEEVESIRVFNVDTQLSEQRVDSVLIVPDVHKLMGQESPSALFSLIPGRVFLWSRNYSLSVRIWEQVPLDRELSVLHPEGEESVKADLLFLPASGLISALLRYPHIRFNPETEETPSGDTLFTFRTAAQPLFHKNFALLSEHLAEMGQEGVKVSLLSENPKQFERLRAILSELPHKAGFEALPGLVHEGFYDKDLAVAWYTDHQIFDRYHKYKVQHKFTKSESLSIQELFGLHPGDYVVHIDHGIGVFGGLEKVELNGRYQESVRLVFRDQDILYVNIQNLHKISKFRGKEGQLPKINKLGSAAWQNLKQSTKKKVKDIARDLILLYARRKEVRGFAFSADSYLQQELEASFMYEDTPDQLKATQAVKAGMEEPYPMDHLVCGDVGFGKTEIAVRAAFKAVTDNKQVAILVPTTILALQHFNTFSSRLANFPCRVEYVSRLKSVGEIRKTLRDTSEGKVDILIGTHRLIGKDVLFKDLGLLIIDEEQKFGVAVKEKLRALKVSVDTLTLTATPIPRTLQFSLMGARELSIINTPPPNRHPIQTELHVFDPELVREAIDYEVSRGGQVFFVANRVTALHEIELMIRNLCPKVQTISAHGQMDGEKLEKIMLDFMAGDYDVLVSTSIVESGLDVPNANTMIVLNAHYFGLADLHQLRGRVGRSNRKAFCYLFTPPVSGLTPEARRRLMAIEQFSELGSGFHIAMQDLDIRGAGNLMGAEQSGFIAEMGFETYQRILMEAMQELHDEEFSSLFDADAQEASTSSTSLTSPAAMPPEPPPSFLSVSNRRREAFFWSADCQIDTDLELLLPESYVANVTERVRLYRELDTMKDEEALIRFRESMIDRFGPLPGPANELLEVVRLRWLAQRLGIERIVMKGGRMVASFIPDPQSAFYQSSAFTAIIDYVRTHPRQVRMKETKDKLTLTTEPVTRVDEAIAFCLSILKEA